MAESEAETPSTPCEFESKYFEYNGVRLPPFCRGKMEEIANFPVRDSDVWIVTYPKSGTGLLQEVVYLVSQGADPDEIGLMNIDEQLPVLEYPQPGLDIIKDLATMVEQLVRFLGVSYDKAQLEGMVEHCHQLIDQCCNAEALPVGRGRVGLWKDIFTVSMNEKFDLVYKQKMGKCDLTFDFYL
ncbi:sulfotransferase 4A1 isoform X2 [Willisornis vidua]|uniref:Sulfotransferase n=1 Tax=Willisornis vidua TaxID=1566151 RepID=A0ABQ9CQG9_9PASS|nr:sulfotransferase 4A1 isoform X2 [Willisornis vidua]